MDINIRKVRKSLSISTLAWIFMWICLFQTSLFGGVQPGTYDVIIKAKPIGEVFDTWVFSKNGKFTSEGLGLEGAKWENTGENTFRVKADKKEIKGGIERLFGMIGLNTSDISIGIEKIEISGTSAGNTVASAATIEGDISTNIRIKVKRPAKTSFSTNGSVSFQGEWYIPYSSKDGQSNAGRTK